MKLLVAILAGAMLFAGEKKDWKIGTLKEVGFTPQAPAGQYPGMKKGVRYVIQSGDEEIVCYHINSSVFGDYRKQLFKLQESVKFRVTKNNVFLLDAAGKEHKLDLFETNVRPK